MLSDGESVEMNVFAKQVVLRAAGVLILQLAVISSAQERSVHNSVSGPSAPSASQTAMAESSQRDQADTNNSANGAVTQPGRAGGLGDPAVGGQRHPLYRLTKSDVIDVNFTFTPEFNQTITVQPDGYLALKGAGTVFAEGLTLPELQQVLSDLYRSFLHEAEINLILKEFDKPYFLASGEVTRPGKYELRGDLTITEAVAIAGGLTQQALHSQVVLFRRVSADMAETHVVNLKKMLGSRDVREDLHLRPGDFIFVPQNRVSKIRKYVPTNAMSWYMNPLQF